MPFDKEKTKNMSMRNLLEGNMKAVDQYIDRMKQA